MFAKRSLLTLVIVGLMTTAVTGQAPRDRAESEEGKTTQQQAQGGGILDLLKKADQALEGSWNVTVNLIAPPPGFPQSFAALETYSRGGGIVTSNNLPPVPRPGQGAWRRNGNRYDVVIQFFLFDPTGAPSGSVRVTHSITLDGNDAYTGAGTAEFFNATGSPLATINFTSQGQRIAP